MVDTWCVMIVCLLKFSINPFTAKWSQRKFSSKFANFILWSFEKQIAVKVQAESFHLNGHIVGFHPQTQKLESPYKTPSSTLAVKGLKSKHSFVNSPNQFSIDLYFVSFYILALSTGFIFVNTALQFEGRWPRVRVSNLPFPSRHYHF